MKATSGVYPLGWMFLVVLLISAALEGLLKLARLVWRAA